MPLDSSIYSMLQQQKPAPGPLDMAAQGLQVQNMVGANRLQGLQTQQAEQTIAMQPELQRLAAVRAGLEGDKLRAETGRAQAETLLKNSTLLRDQLAGVRDQPSYDAWRELGARLMGPDMAAKVPPVFDPKAQADMLRKADDFNLSMADKLRLDETKRHNLATEGGQAAARAETGRHNLAVEGGNKATAVSQIRKEFNDLPEVKNFRAVVPIINSAIEAPDNKSGDIQFAYTIGKIFDPNSVVREGELKLVGEAANVFQKYIGEVQALTQGKGRLTAQTRQELLQAAMARVNELKSANDAARTTYEQEVTRRGLPSAEIFVEMPKIKEPKKPVPAAPPPAATPANRPSLGEIFGT